MDYIPINFGGSKDLDFLRDNSSLIYLEEVERNPLKVRNPS